MKNEVDKEILRLLKLLINKKEYILTYANYVGEDTDEVLFFDGYELNFNLGVCAFILISGNYAYDIELEYFESWSGYSGNINYPVDDKVFSSNCWCGESGLKRFSLIEHLITCYENQLNCKGETQCN